MIFLSNATNNIDRKYIGKPLHFFVGVYLFFMLSILHLSCSNSSVRKAGPEKLQYTDTLKIRAESIFRIYVSKMPAVNGTDSVLLLLDRNASLLYKIDTANHLLGVDTLPAEVIEGLKTFTYYKGGYCLQYEDTFKIFKDANFRTKPQIYSFNNGDVYAFQSISSEFKIDSDQSFLIYCFPKINNINEAAGRAQFFGSEVVHKGVIEKGSALIRTKPQFGITFPQRYKKFYYNDMAPDFCSFSDSIAYTLQYCDSLTIVYEGKKDYFKIPEQFSVTAEPVPEEHVQSRTQLDAYYATHNSNIKLLRHKRKILLFQAIRSEMYVDEQAGVLNDFLSQKKMMIIFDMDKKQFEQKAYELPPNCNPVKSVIFNGKVYLFSTDETRKVISILPVTL